MLEVHPTYLAEVYYEMIEKYGAVEAYLFPVCYLENKSVPGLKHFLGTTCCNKEKFECKVLTSILNQSNIFYVMKNMSLLGEAPV